MAENLRWFTETNTISHAVHGIDIYATMRGRVCDVEEEFVTIRVPERIFHRMELDIQRLCRDRYGLENRDLRCVSIQDFKDAMGSLMQQVQEVEVILPDVLKTVFGGHSDAEIQEILKEMHLLNAKRKTEDAHMFHTTSYHREVN